MKSEPEPEPKPVETERGYTRAQVDEMVEEKILERVVRCNGFGYELCTKIRDTFGDLYSHNVQFETFGITTRDLRYGEWCKYKPTAYVTTKLVDGRAVISIAYGKKESGT